MKYDSEWTPKRNCCMYCKHKSLIKKRKKRSIEYKTQESLYCTRCEKYQMKMREQDDSSSRHRNNRT